jgi:hypothetical protein
MDPSVSDLPKGKPIKLLDGLIVDVAFDFYQVRNDVAAPTLWGLLINPPST